MYHMCAENQEDQRVSGPLELEWQVVESCLMQVLGTKPRSSALLTTEPFLQCCEKRFQLPTLVINVFRLEKKDTFTSFENKT